ncbi:hypothetical protein GCM10027168_62520 [Streptomyces capparidis]
MGGGRGNGSADEAPHPGAGPHALPAAAPGRRPAAPTRHRTAPAPALSLPPSGRKGDRRTPTYAGRTLNG